MTALFALLLFGGAADLTVRELPTRVEAPGLAMRAGGRRAARKAAPPRPAPPKPPTAGAPIGTLPAPRPTAEAAPEIHYRLNLGYGSDTARATGAQTISGFPANPNVFRSYLFGDATLGARGVPIPSLGTYFAANYYYDFLGASLDSPFTTVYDADGTGRALLIRSGYAELDPGAHGGPPVWLRAGRQFRIGAGTAHFDGASLGYEGRALEASGFFGRRVDLYDCGSALGSCGRGGLLGGGALRTSIPVGAGRQVQAAVEVLGFEGDLYTDVTARLGGPAAQATAGVRFFGASLSDAFLRARFALGRRATLFADGSEKIGAAPLYDYVTGGEAAGLRFFTLPELLTQTRLRGGASLAVTSALELLGYAAASVIESQQPAPGPPRTGFDASYAEVGILGDLRPGAGLAIMGGWRARLFARPDPAAELRLDDPVSAGETSYQEALLETRYTLGLRRLTVTASAFLRVYDLQTGWQKVGGEARGGVRFDVESWLVARVRVKAAYELADPSPVFSPDVDTLQSLRVIVEATF